MNDLTLLGPWVRRFLLEHLIAERNLARNTQRSYRDALAMLIPFVAVFGVDFPQQIASSLLGGVSVGLAWLVLAEFRITLKTRFMLWLGLWESTVQSILHGVVRFVPFPSKRRIRH